MKRLKDLFELRGLNADAGVDDRDRHFVLFFHQADEDLAIGFGKLDRIINQLVDYPTDPLSIRIGRLIFFP